MHTPITFTVLQCTLVVLMLFGLTICGIRACLMYAVLHNNRARALVIFQSLIDHASTRYDYAKSHEEKVRLAVIIETLKLAIGYSIKLPDRWDEDTLLSHLVFGDEVRGYKKQPEKAAVCPEQSFVACKKFVPRNHTELPGPGQLCMCGSFRQHHTFAAVDVFLRKHAAPDDDEHGMPDTAFEFADGLQTVSCKDFLPGNNTQAPGPKQRCMCGAIRARHSAEALAVYMNTHRCERFRISTISSLSVESKEDKLCLCGKRFADHSGSVQARWLAQEFVSPMRHKFVGGIGEEAWSCGICGDSEADPRHIVE